MGDGIPTVWGDKWSAKNKTKVNYDVALGGCKLTMAHTIDNQKTTDVGEEIWKGFSTGGDCVVDIMPFWGQ